MDLVAEEIAVARAVAVYVRANPLACDAADGIRRWWLGVADVPMETLVRALDWMTRQGLMEELVAADGRQRHRRCASDAQLEAGLRQLDSGPGAP